MSHCHETHVLSPTRDTYAIDMTHVVHTMTWMPTTSNWTLFWSRRIVHHLPYTSCAHPLVNHIPYLTITSKRHLESVSRYMIKVCNLPQCRAFTHDTMEIRSHPTEWIQKSISHRHVTLYNGRRTRDVVFQKRVHAMYVPGTRRIFDLGVYVLVRSVHPLRYSVYNQWLVRLCTHDDSSNTSRLRNEPNRFVVGASYDTLLQFPHLSSVLSFCNSSADCALRLMLQKQVNVSRIDRDMHDVIRCTLEYDGRHNYGRHNYGRHNYGRHNYGRHNYGRRYSYFELLRYDFLLNRSDAYPHLMEINMSPSLHPYFFPNDGHLKRTVVRDVVRILKHQAVEHWTDSSGK